MDTRNEAFPAICPARMVYALRAVPERAVLFSRLPSGGKEGSVLEGRGRDPGPSRPRGGARGLRGWPHQILKTACGSRPASLRISLRRIFLVVVLGSSSLLRMKLETCL